MRFVAVVLLVLCAPTFAQELDINGYSKAVVPRAQGNLVHVNSSLRQALRDAGFEVHGSVEDIPAEAWPSTLYVTGRAIISARRLAAVVAIYDVATQTRIAACTRDLSIGSAGRDSMLGRPVRLAIERLIKDLGYQGFNESAHEANLRAHKLVATGTDQSVPPPPSPLTLRMACRAVIATSSEAE